MLLAMMGWVRVVTDRAPDLPPVLEAVGTALKRVPESYDPERKRNAALQREILSAFAARYDGRFEDALSTSDATLARLEAGDPLIRGLLTFNMARSHMALGAMDAAAPLLDRSFDDNLRAGNHYLVLAGLGQSVAVAAQREGVHRAAETVATAVTFAEERGLTGLPAYSTVLYNLGHVHYLSDALDEAADSFGRAVALGRASGFPEGHANGLVGLARVALARRDLAEAESLLIDAAALAQARNVVLLDTTIELERARLAFAREVAGELPPSSAQASPQNHTTGTGAGAWSAIEEGWSILAMWRAVRAQRYDRAGALVDRLETESAKLGRGVALCSAMAGAVLLPDREDGRWERVEQLLDVAAARGYIRPLLDGGEPVRALIHAAGARSLSPAGRTFATELLERFDGHGPGGGQTPASGLEGLLTDREEEVLAYLAQDLSNKAIARAMFVSTETVKTHLKHLYGKLGANTRRQAVVRAREMGLTPVQLPDQRVPHS
jgi:LuxR family transcriptional regulator, maltose regulon positive regulatory protein